MYNSYTYIYIHYKKSQTATSITNKRHVDTDELIILITWKILLMSPDSNSRFNCLRPSRVTLSIMAEVVMQDASFSCVRIKLVKRTSVLIECFVYPQMTLLLPFDSVYFCFIKPNQKNLVCSGLFSYVRNPLNCSLIQKSRE